jgi:monoamine oxidase
MSKIDRRKFLKRSAAAVAGVSLARSSAFSAITVGVAPKKILIIGAGMAGLCAGYELSAQGHDVTILEARMRPGGRVHTLREPFSDGLYAEAGAARIPDNHDLTLKYVKLFDLPLEPMYPTQLSAVRWDGKSAQRISTGDFTKALGSFFGDELGEDPARWSKIKGGSDLLPQAFAQKLAGKIQYGAAVVRLEQDANAARAVYLRNGVTETLSADRILCALPFSLLRNIRLPSSFSERKIKVIKNLKYDSVSRVYLQAKKRSWEEQGLNGFAIRNDGVEIWQPTWNQPGPRGILMTYARPGVAEQIAKMKESERISSTLSQLDPMFPGLNENFERGTTKCWIEDEWSRGAWAFVGLNFGIASAPEGRIHFAGEHLSPWFSWMQGALESSLRAVKQIHEAA